MGERVHRRFSRDSDPGPSDHTNHTHTGTSHRLLVDVGDLNTTLNPGATYYAEAQTVTPHEYVWCQAHAGQCNMDNNVSYRQFSVTGRAASVFQLSDHSANGARDQRVDGSNHQ